MLLTITTTHQPASDLGFLLEKHPARSHEFEVAGGKATVFYPEATQERCTVALLLDVDPIGLIRGRGGHKTDRALDQYVTDRPYVASSFLSVALGTAFRSALAGRSRSRPELALTAIPLQVSIPVLPGRGGEVFVRSLFEPLGYEVELTGIPLDEKFPEWGNSPYFSVTLRSTRTVQQLLQHLYVLIPVLDDNKHYWVGEAEVEKLLRHASEWLGDHPQKERITHRYFKHRRSLTREALSRLTAEDEADPVEAESNVPESQLREQRIEEKTSLNERRIEAVEKIVQELGSKTLLDLGCGEGRVLAALMKLKQLDRLVGVDVAIRVLEYAHERLNLDRLPPRQRQRIDLLHGSLIYKDDRLNGFDVATVIEVIEHLDLPRLAAFERVLFEFARPQSVVVTTPNSEYNVRYDNLKPGQFRHGDHRFEWTRAEFRRWCDRQAGRFGYAVEYRSVGEEDPELGPPTQMAVFQLTVPVSSNPATEG
jgi:3' terminal RNA ribose 2'-O-methyltransferase Hen1